MPLVRRKRGLDAGESQLETRACKRFKSGNKKLFEFDKIGYVQDQFHSLHRSLPDELNPLQGILLKEIGSFLNGKGGILCFGCRENGTVYGDPLPRKEEDSLKLVIDDVFKKFRPMVQPQRYRVTCTQLGDRFRAKEPRVVVEIRVQAGDDYEMYEDQNHETYLRRGAAPYGPLTPHEIKRLTTQQLRQKMKALRPVQKALLTPIREKPVPEVVRASFAVPRAKPVVEEKTRFRIKLKRGRQNSSGSDEDPIAIAVVKPLTAQSMQSETSSTGQKVERIEKMDTSKKENEATKNAKKPANAAISRGSDSKPPLSSVAGNSRPTGSKSQTTKHASISHPLAQAVKSVVPSAPKSTPSAVAKPSGTAPKPPNPASVATRSRQNPTSEASSIKSVPAQAVKSSALKSAPSAVVAATKPSNSPGTVPKPPTVATKSIENPATVKSGAPAQAVKSVAPSAPKSTPSAVTATTKPLNPPGTAAAVATRSRQNPTTKAFSVKSAPPAQAVPKSTPLAVVAATKPTSKPPTPAAMAARSRLNPTTKASSVIKSAPPVQAVKPVPTKPVGTSALTASQQSTLSSVVDSRKLSDPSRVHAMVTRSRESATTKSTTMCVKSAPTANNPTEKGKSKPPTTNTATPSTKCVNSASDLPPSKLGAGRPPIPPAAVTSGSAMANSKPPPAKKLPAKATAVQSSLVAKSETKRTTTASDKTLPTNAASTRTTPSTKTTPTNVATTRTTTSTKTTPTNVATTRTTPSTKTTPTNVATTRTTTSTKTTPTNVATTRTTTSTKTTPTNVATTRTTTSTKTMPTNAASTTSTKTMPTKCTSASTSQNKVPTNRTTPSATRTAITIKVMPTPMKNVATTTLKPVQPVVPGSSSNTRLATVHSLRSSDNTTGNKKPAAISSGEATKTVTSTGPVLNNHSVAATLHARAVPTPVRVAPTTTMPPQQQQQQPSAKIATVNNKPQGVSTFTHSQSAKNHAQMNAMAIAMSTCKKAIPLQHNNTTSQLKTAPTQRYHHSSSHNHARYHKQTQRQAQNNNRQFFPPPPPCPPQLIAYNNYYDPHCCPYPPNNAPYAGFVSYYQQSAVQMAWNTSAQNLRRH